MCACGCLRNVMGSFAENQKLQLLRSTYQKAVATPLLGVENVWKEYNQFENVSTVNNYLLTLIVLWAFTCKLNVQFQLDWALTRNINYMFIH